MLNGFHIKYSVTYFKILFLFYIKLNEPNRIKVELLFLILLGSTFVNYFNNKKHGFPRDRKKEREIQKRKESEQCHSISAYFLFWLDKVC